MAKPFKTRITPGRITITPQTAEGWQKVILAAGVVTFGQIILAMAMPDYGPVFVIAQLAWTFASVLAFGFWFYRLSDVVKGSDDQP